VTVWVLVELFMLRAPRKIAAGPELSPETIRRVDILFAPQDRGQAKELLYERCGQNLPFQDQASAPDLERVRFAALRYSDGKLDLLERAVKRAQADWRDLLLAADFAHDAQAHARWEPKPAGEPPEIDPPRLAAAIHYRLMPVLIPLGFERFDDQWRRDGEVPQTLHLQSGAPNRSVAKFFLNVTIEAKPMNLLLALPKLPPTLGEFREQGYVFRAGGDEEVLFGKVVEDVIRHARPLFERFTSNQEVQRGFDDGTFKRRVLVEGQALLF
jgi:hypothetical protein